MGRVGFDVRDTQSRQDGDLFPTINAPLHCLCHLSWPLFPHQCSSPLPLPSLPVSPSISGAAALLSNKASIRSSFLGVHRVGSHKQVFRLALPSVWLRLNLCLLWGLLRACFRDEYYSYIKKNYFFLSIHLLMNMWVVCSFGSIKNRASMSNYLLISSGHKFHFSLLFWADV